MALQLRESDVPTLINPEHALAAVRQAHKDLSLGIAVNVPRRRAKLPKAILHAMSAASSSLGLAATKSYTATPNGVHSYVQLFSAESGELLAHIAANEMGRMRTSAASVIAAAELSEKAPSRLALIGTGYQAAGLISSASTDSSGLALKEIRIYSPKAESRRRLIDAVRNDSASKLVDCSSVEEALDGAQTVFTATASSKPVLPETLPDSVRHISALGSNSLARRELFPRTVTGARMIVVDEKDTARIEGGNLLTPLENGKLNWQNIVELGDLLSGKIARPDGRGYTLFCSHGLAVQDLYIAAAVYRAATLNESSRS